MPTSPAKDKQILAVADYGSVRADEMPCGSTDPDDDNLCLSPNADIPAHVDNDLPRPYATYGENYAAVGSILATCVTLRVLDLMCAFQ
ncbi:hypothetical protein Tco_0103034 [Tanacetum coccineum]